MSRLTFKTAALLLLSAGAACAHAPDKIHAATAMSNAAAVTFNAAYPSDVNGAKSFTGGRFVANAIPRAVPANEIDSLANIPAGM